jgi:DNA polymerase-3 subunit delta'
MIPEWLKTEFDPLTELIQRDKLPHALLIHGPAGTGRRLLALSIIGRVLGIEVTESEAALATGALVDEERAPVHPDFRLVQIPVEKRFIPIDSIRQLIGFMNLTSHQRGYKTALINPANAMTRDAANSLLKTLEEPPGASVTVLITDSLSRLPATIVSRCHRVRVAVPSTAAAMAWLQQQDPKGDWESVLSLAGGAPVRALAYRREGAIEKVADFARDVDALARRRASPVEVARRWARVDPELCLNWLYQAIAAELRGSGESGGPQRGIKSGSGRLQNGTESLNIERAFGDLRKVGELKRLQGRGLNAELQLSGILTRWYGAQAPA